VLFNTTVVGPCGEVLQQEIEGVGDATTRRTWLFEADYAEPTLLSESQTAFAVFAPTGRAVVVTDAESVVMHRLGGEPVTLAEVAGATVHWMRDPDALDRLLPLVCADGRVTLVDGGAERVLAEDAFSCEAIARDAPVLVYRRESDGVLVRVDARASSIVELPGVDFADETFVPEEVARDDRVTLSPDGRVLIHQRMWRRPFSGFVPERWATLFDTADGDEIAPIQAPSDYQPLVPVAMPGHGHTLVFPSDERLTVLTPSLDFVFFEGWEVAPEPVRDRLLVREVTSGDVWLMDAATAVLSGPVFEDTSSLSQVVASKSRELLVAQRRERVCDDGVCRNVDPVLVWRSGAPAQEVTNANGIVQVRWVGDDGRLLLSGPLFGDDGETVVSGLHLLDPNGEVVARWVDANEGSTARSVDGTLFFTLFRGDPRTGYNVQELLAVDPATGLSEIVAAGDRGVFLATDDAESRVVWGWQWAVEDRERGIFEIHNRVVAGPVPDP
jgi:hypothetical protein